LRLSLPARHANFPQKSRCAWSRAARRQRCLRARPRDPLHRAMWPAVVVDKRTAAARAAHAGRCERRAHGHTLLTSRRSCRSPSLSKAFIRPMPSRARGKDLRGQRRDDVVRPTRLASRCREPHRRAKAAHGKAELRRADRGIRALNSARSGIAGAPAFTCRTGLRATKCRPCCGATSISLWATTWRARWQRANSGIGVPRKPMRVLPDAPTLWKYSRNDSHPGRTSGRRARENPSAVIARMPAETLQGAGRTRPCARWCRRGQRAAAGDRTRGRRVRRRKRNVGRDREDSGAKAE